MPWAVKVPKKALVACTKVTMAGLYETVKTAPAMFLVCPKAVASMVAVISWP